MIANQIQGEYEINFAIISSTSHNEHRSNYFLLVFFAHSVQTYADWLEVRERPLYSRDPPVRRWRRLYDSLLLKIKLQFTISVSVIRSTTARSWADHKSASMSPLLPVVKNGRRTLSIDRNTTKWNPHESPLCRKMKFWFQSRQKINLKQTKQNRLVI